MELMKKPRTYKVESLHDGSFEKNKLEHKIRRPFTTCIIALVDLGSILLSVYQLYIFPVKPLQLFIEQIVLKPVSQ